MSTQNIFRPGLHQSRVLKETAASGLTRIEISYYADSPIQEKHFWKSDFIERAKRHIEWVEAAVFEANYLEDSPLCYALPLSSLFHHFEQVVK